MSSDEQQKGITRLVAARYHAYRLWRRARFTLGMIALVVATGIGGIALGYDIAKTPLYPSSTDQLPPVRDYDTVPTIPPRVCGAPSPLNPGTGTDEPSESAPTTPCVPPAPDVIVLLSSAKSKALPANVGGIDCEMTDPYDNSVDYSACNPQHVKDVEVIAKKLLTPEQLAFVNDHVLSRDAYWAFDIKDTATLKNRFMVPGASYDVNSGTITVHVW